MNREDIIATAHKAGLHIATEVHWMPIIGFEYLERFAKLVAQAEREQCARVCDQYTDERYANMADMCAAAIRNGRQA